MARRSLLLLFLMAVTAGCATTRPGEPVARRGDEIVVCGQYFHTGAPVVLWTDPGGYDGYRVEKRFAPWDKSQWPAQGAAAGEKSASGSKDGHGAQEGQGSEGAKNATPWGLTTPNRYGVRFAESGRGPGGTGTRLDPETFERVRGGGWDLDALRKVVDQFVIHYDVCGTSRACFRVLHDTRGLSVHFLLDVDGTIYQTL